MLADHGDGTFTVKYAAGQTEEDVPRECVRATAATAGRRGGRSRDASQKSKDGRVGFDDLWLAVERMASELAKRAGIERKNIPLSSLEGETDQVQLGWESFFGL